MYGTILRSSKLLDGARGARVIGVIGIIGVVGVCMTAGCPAGKQAGPQQPSVSPADANKRSGGQDGITGSGDSADPCDQSASNGDAALPARGAPCVTPVCMYHGGSDSYHQCLSGGAGECFHFGASCEPKHACMYDAGTASYRICASPSDGLCEAFSLPCVPPDRCMYNAEDRRYHRCEQAAEQAAKNGRCARFGPVCDPS